MLNREESRGNGIQNKYHVMIRWGKTGGGWDELVQRALGYEARGRVRTVMTGDQGR